MAEHYWAEEEQRRSVKTRLYKWAINHIPPSTAAPAVTPTPRSAVGVTVG